MQILSDDDKDYERNKVPMDSEGRVYFSHGGQGRLPGGGDTWADCHIAIWGESHGRQSERALPLS